MTAATLAAPKTWNPFSFLAQRKSATPENAGDEERARRAFIQEMLTRSPDAFASELDVQSMLHMYPGRF